MKVTLITVCRNAAHVIAGSLESVLEQSHTDIELIVIDGASTDGTCDILATLVAAPGKRGINTLVSEPDKGIYDAMNKGLALATGDVIGFVNAGDMLMTRDTIAHVAAAFERSATDVIYGDIIMVDEKDIHKVHRTWLSGTYQRDNFKRGWMPPHVGTFIRRRVYEQFGQFNTSLRIAADYEILLRFIYVHRANALHLPEVLVRFRLGGMSNGSIKHVLRANREVRASWGLNGLRPPPLLVTRKLWSKVMQFFH